MYDIADHRERIRTLTHDRDTVRFPLGMKREEEFKNALTGFHMLGLQMPDKFTNITKLYFEAVVGHLNSQGQFPVLNEHIFDNNGAVTNLQFNQDIIDSFYSTITEHYRVMSPKLVFV